MKQIVLGRLAWGRQIKNRFLFCTAEVGGGIGEVNVMGAIYEIEGGKERRGVQHWVECSFDFERNSLTVLN